MVDRGRLSVFRGDHRDRKASSLRSNSQFKAREECEKETALNVVLFKLFLLPSPHPFYFRITIYGITCPCDHSTQLKTSEENVVSFRADLCACHYRQPHPNV